ncbi:MAG: prenyl protease-related protein [Spartobacteria bacterium]|nr:prenyl protease-related protein [Spartobacteria bacterium]
MNARNRLIAYVAPMGAFVVMLAANGLLKGIDHSVWLTTPEYWIYPLQTAVCAALLYWFWPAYSLQRPNRLFLALGIGVAVWLIWVSPQLFLGFPPRTSGFNPDVFAAQSTLYWPTVILRFLRLVVVVPLVEEIFWRGFLLRYLIDEKFDHVVFGTFSWFSFLGVTLAFTFSHTRPDWVVAVITGMLYNGVAYWTKSLSACVVTHAVTNLLLGLWIMQTKQWGFW